MDHRGDDSVADCDIRSFPTRFPERKHARRASAEINEHLIAAHGRDDPFDDLAWAERPEGSLILFDTCEELCHRLGLAVGPYFRIDGHDRARANDVPPV